MIIKNVEKKETTTKGSRNEGKMNFVREGKKIPHTITNIPVEGVYMGVCEIIYYLFIYLFILFIYFFFFLF
jgi:hypothetical protein